MAKITRTVLTAFICALICSLCIAATAWADETSPTDQNGKWITGETYEGGTGAVCNAHPGMHPDTSVHFAYDTPPSDALYSLAIRAEWFVSSDQENWTALKLPTNTLPDVGEEGYTDVVNHYVKAKVTYTYSVKADCSADGKHGYITYVTETDSAYVSPHDWDPNSGWTTGDGYHWHACVSNVDSQCPYQFNHEACAKSSDTFYNDQLDHWYQCKCGGACEKEPHDFTTFVEAYLKEHPNGEGLDETLYLTCDECGALVEMSREAFMNAYVYTPGATGTPDAAGTAPDSVYAEVTPAIPAPEATDAKKDAAKENTADQAAFARTNDPISNYLLGIGATTLAAAAIAFVAHKRTKA